jgi:tRNA1(Val) A37 N6-methylase TrmN6
MPLKFDVIVANPPFNKPTPPDAPFIQRKRRVTADPDQRWHAWQRAADPVGALTGRRQPRYLAGSG